MHHRSESTESAPGAPTSDAVIASEAARWVVRQDRGLTPREHRLLADWAQADARHAAELARLGIAWNWLDGARNSPGLADLADEIHRRARDRRAHRRQVRVALFAAAAVVVAGYLGWSRWSESEPAETALSPDGNYRVLASTLRRLTLPDGSIAELNGSSRVVVDFSPSERRVRLLEGEAHFVVAKNPARPFFVSAGSVTVRAVGTAFNVRLASDTIEVLVTEGTVKLDPDASPAANQPNGSPLAQAEAGPALTQGQRAVIDRDPAPDAATSVTIGEVGQAEMDEALGWQSTRLAFNNTPLDEVVAGFNRYNRHRLTLGDPNLRGRTLTGVFRADNLDGFIRLLRASIDVKAELRTADETVLLPAR